MQKVILKSNLSKVRVRLRKAKIVNTRSSAASVYYANFDRQAAQTSKAEEYRIL